MSKKLVLGSPVLGYSKDIRIYPKITFYRSWLRRVIPV